jgi:serine/threonine protein kinase
VLSSLAFLHSLGLVHADLKPENILIKSYSRCAVKVIDLGSSCFLTDHLSSYVQASLVSYSFVGFPLFYA